MLTTKIRLKLQDIMTRLSKNKVVSLDERILVQKYADGNSTVWHWLRKARPIRAKVNLDQGSMGGFMQQMNLPGQTSEDHFNWSQDDLGEWFQGSPQRNGFVEADPQVVEEGLVCGSGRGLKSRRSRA